MSLYSIESFEPYFQTAIHRNYVRGLSKKQIQFLKEWYYAQTGKDEKLRSGCTSCSVQFIRKVAEVYYTQYKPIPDIEVTTTQEIIEEVVIDKVVITTPKNKGGRPKKIN